MKSKITCLTIAALLALTTAAQADFFNGFEGGDFDWGANVTRVDTTDPGFSGTPATAASGDWYATTSGAQTFWGYAGYNEDWGGGFTTSIDLYLDYESTGSDFSWMSAIADNLGGDLDGYTFTGSLSGSNYSINVGSLSGDAPTGPTSWTTNGAGWYTLQHSFAASGEYLQVELSILGASDTPLTSWTFDTGYAIPGVGGSALGGFSGSADFAIDNTSMTTAVVPVPGALLLAGFGLSCAGLHLRRRRS